VEPFCIQAQPHKGYDGDNGCESKRDIDGGWEGRTFFFFLTEGRKKLERMLNMINVEIIYWTYGVFNSLNINFFV
jgi:hypothetical protein